MKSYYKTVAIIIMTSLLSIGCSSKPASTKQLSPEELQRAAEEKEARTKHQWCTYLAKYTFKGDSYKEMVQLKKIRDRGFDDSECQHYYDTQLNKYTSGTWVRKLKSLGKERKRIIIHENKE